MKAKVPLSEYQPVLATVDYYGNVSLFRSQYLSPADQKAYGKYHGSVITAAQLSHSKNTHNGPWIDLRTIGPNQYNSKTGQWKLKAGAPPVITEFMPALNKGEHPLTTKPQDWVAWIKEIVEQSKPKKGEFVNTATIVAIQHNGTRYERLCPAVCAGSLGLDEQNRLRYLYDWYSHLVCIGAYKEINDLLATNAVTPTSKTEVPKLSPEEQKKVLINAQAQYHARNGWNLDPPAECEFEDNTEMLAKIEQLFSGIPGFEVTYLRKRKLAYCSDGGMDLTPDAINLPKFNRQLYVSHKQGADICVAESKPSSSWNLFSRPLIYIGEAWCLKFLIDGKDVTQNNYIYFVTPEQFLECYQKYRPDLVENFKPWSDLIFISSDWCERNGTKNYSKGIDLQTPHQRRMGLFQWVIGPCAGHALRHGTPFPGVSVLNGNDQKTRIAQLEKFLGSKEPAPAVPVPGTTSTTVTTKTKVYSANTNKSNWSTDDSW